jgi:hypothetical protein
MHIEYAKNPIWVNPEHTAIDLVVKFKEIAQEIPFTSMAVDTQSHTIELFNNAVAGLYGNIAEYEPLPEQNLNTIVQITMRQFKLALLNQGLLSSVNATIDQISDEITRETVRIEWQYATVVKKNSEWVNTLLTGLNLSPEECDSLFIEASTL